MGAPGRGPDTEPVPGTGEAPRRTPGWRGLYSPRHELRLARAELGRWRRGMRRRVQVDPRRWTVHGWANAAYLLVVVLLVAVGHHGDDGSSPVFVVGIVVLHVARGAFAWRRRRDGARPDATVPDGCAPSGPGSGR